MTAIDFDYIRSLRTEGQEHLKEEVAPLFNEMCEAGEWDDSQQLPPFFVAAVILLMYADEVFRRGRLDGQDYRWNLTVPPHRGPSVGAITLGRGDDTDTLVLMHLKEGAVQYAIHLEPRPFTELVPVVEDFVKEVHAAL